MTMLSTIFINHKSTKKNNKRGQLRTIIKGEDTEKKYFFNFVFPFLSFFRQKITTCTRKLILPGSRSICKAIPYGIRTRVLAMKRRCPIPLDERDKIISKKNGQPELRCNKKWHYLRPVARLCATFVFHLPTIIHKAFN